MKSFNKCMDTYKEQLKEGSIQVAYRGLLEYIMSLRAYFSKKYPEFIVPSNIYFGYMDMTYFSIIPISFKDKKLKIAIVFNYETFGFEVWLSAVNKNVLTKYWKLIKEKTDKKILNILVGSAVGEATATEFMAFLRLSLLRVAPLTPSTSVLPESNIL